MKSLKRMGGQLVTVRESSVLKGAYWLQYVPHFDKRGFFTEAFSSNVVAQLTGAHIAQINVSGSSANVLRGMHAHASQYDIWYLVEGIAEVMLHSPFMPINDKPNYDKRVLFPHQGVVIPPGVGHGFYAVTNMKLLYAVTREYDGDDPDEYEYYAGNLNWSIPSGWHMSTRDEGAPGRLPMRQFYQALTSFGMNPNQVLARELAKRIKVMNTIAPNAFQRLLLAMQGVSIQAGKLKNAFLHLSDS